MEEVVMTKTDKKMLSYLQPYDGDNRYLQSDLYFLGICKFLKNDFTKSVAQKVEGWVLKNGGRITFFI